MRIKAKQIETELEQAKSSNFLVKELTLPQPLPPPTLFIITKNSKETVTPLHTGDDRSRVERRLAIIGRNLSNNLVGLSLQIGSVLGNQDKEEKISNITILPFPYKNPFIKVLLSLT